MKLRQRLGKREKKNVIPRELITRHIEVESPERKSITPRISDISSQNSDLVKFIVKPRNNLIKNKQRRSRSYSMSSYDLSNSSKTFPDK